MKIEARMSDRRWPELVITPEDYDEYIGLQETADELFNISCEEFGDTVGFEIDQVARRGIVSIHCYSAPQPRR